MEHTKAKCQCAGLTPGQEVPFHSHCTSKSKTSARPPQEKTKTWKHHEASNEDKDIQMAIQVQRALVPVPSIQPQSLQILHTNIHLPSSTMHSKPREWLHQSSLNLQNRLNNSARDWLADRNTISNSFTVQSLPGPCDFMDFTSETFLVKKPSFLNAADATRSTITMESAWLSQLNAILTESHYLLKEIWQQSLMLLNTSESLIYWVFGLAPAAADLHCVGVPSVTSKATQLSCKLFLLCLGLERLRLKAFMGIHNQWSLFQDMFKLEWIYCNIYNSVYTQYTYICTIYMRNYLSQFYDIYGISTDSAAQRYKAEMRSNEQVWGNNGRENSKNKKEQTPWLEEWWSDYKEIQRNSWG